MRIGKLLWWDKRDQNGVVEDESGTRFYVDASVVEPSAVPSLKSGDTLGFDVNSALARNIKKLKDLDTNCDQNKGRNKP